MKVEALDNFTAISFLANGNGVYRKPILLRRVSWREYQCFLKEFEEKAGWRLAYDNGDLEIMPPLRQHELPSRSVHNFVLAYCEHFDLTLESAGSTTFRRRAKKKGVEPDECFYIQNAVKIIGVKDEKTEDYLVPDVAVEMDVTHGSLDEFRIYAALGVSEVWVYNGKNAIFYQLAGGEYIQTDASSALPKLTATTLTAFLALLRDSGQSAALKKFRQWLQKLDAE